MTNREKYKQAFSAIRASDNFSLEAEKMENKAKHRRFKPVVAAVAACVMLVGSAAADRVVKANQLAVLQNVTVQEAST